MIKIKKNIIHICQEAINNNKYDIEAKDYFFEIKYDKNVKIDLIHIYEIYDKNNKIKHKRTSQRIDELNMSLEEYCNFLIKFYEFKIRLGQWSEPKEKIYKKINIVR